MACVWSAANRKEWPKNPDRTFCKGRHGTPSSSRTFANQIAFAMAHQVKTLPFPKKIRAR